MYWNNITVATSQKGGPQKHNFFSFFCNMHGQQVRNIEIMISRIKGPRQNVDDDYCACQIKAVGGGGYSYIRGPHIFSEQGPR